MAWSRHIVLPATRVRWASTARSSARSAARASAAAALGAAIYLLRADATTSLLLLHSSQHRRLFAI